MTDILLRTGESELRLSGARRTVSPAALREVIKRVDLAVPRGSVLGLVGESGSGKTTLGRLLVRLLQPTSGGIQFDGVEIGRLGEAEMRPLRARIQMIFQDPQSSLNPRLRLGVTLTRPLKVFGRLKGRRDQRERAAALLDLVGLPTGFRRPLSARTFGRPAPARRHRPRAGARAGLHRRRRDRVRPRCVDAGAYSAAAAGSCARRLGLTLVFISHDLSRRPRALRRRRDPAAWRGRRIRSGRPHFRIAPASPTRGSCSPRSPCPTSSRAGSTIARPIRYPQPARISRMTETIKGSVVLITGATGAIAQALIAELTRARRQEDLRRRARHLRPRRVGSAGADQDGRHQRR